MGRVLAVTSGKGGVGKSTVSVGLAAAFCKRGERVLLVDMDEGLRCLDLMLGTDSSTVFDLADILAGKEIGDAVYPIQCIKGAYLIPAPSDFGRIDVFSLTGFAKCVREDYDTVIFDFPAGIDYTLYTALPEDTVFLTVAIPEPVSVRDAAAAGAKLTKLGFSARLVINRFEYKAMRRGECRNIDEMIDLSCIRLVGVVPESGALKRFSVMHRLPERSRAFKAFKRLTARICGENAALPKPKKI